MVTSQVSKIAYSLDEVFGLLRRMCMVMSESLTTQPGGGNCDVVKALMKLQIVVLSVWGVYSGMNLHEELKCNPC